MLKEMIPDLIESRLALLYIHSKMCLGVLEFWVSDKYGYSYTQFHGHSGHAERIQLWNRWLEKKDQVWGSLLIVDSKTIWDRPRSA